ncbi:YbfB/YjiJ family MFS transporter [Tepidamorphus sp. 3E244]|uniref:YbfB/YjiJ family MFS transporter n=1 Tax=Tepidamorphus sp. 3E244 TaxID=3385498 RepID=UPI0038FC2EA0
MSLRDPSPLALAAGGFLALAAAMGFGRFAYTAILPDMLAAGQLDGAGAGYLAASNFAGYLAGALLAASPYLSGSRSVWSVVGLVASAATTAAMGVTDSMFAFMLLRFAGGFASAIVLVFATALVLDGVALAGRNGLSAVHFAGVGFGICVSALAVHWLKGPDLWPEQWLVFGLFTILIAFACVPLLRESGPKVPRSEFTPGKVGLDTRFIALLISYGLFGFGYIITATFITAIVRNSPELAPHETAVWFTVGLALMPSVWFWSQVSARTGPLIAYAIACMLEAAGVIASVSSSHPPAIFFAAVCLGGTFVGITAIGLVAARMLPTADGTPRDARRVVALMTASFGIGQVLGPAVAGWLYGQTGDYLGASAVAAFLLIVSAAIVVWIAASLKRARLARA